MDVHRHSGAVAIVTGAGSGIGRATVIRLLGEGATVLGVDVNGASLEAVSTSLGDAAERFVAVTADLTDPVACDAVVDRADEHGGVDLLANVAGIMDNFMPVGDIDDELWERVFAVNITAPMRLCRRALKTMVERQRGSIVNVASIAALGGSGAGAAYHASKHAVLGLSRHIAFLYRMQGVRCNVVCPGGVNTGMGNTDPSVAWAFERQLLAMTLNERMAEPDEIAAAISWLLSDEASNVNGAIFPVDGGWKAA
jgi:NAD(P)-dependent dehydrogenase (short-subunit alcohol dehydrogenase family)